MTNSFKDKIKPWKIVFYCSVVLFFIACFYTIKLYSRYSDLYINDVLSQKHNQENFIKCKNCVRRKIDGVYVKPGNDNIYPVAVIFDNHPEARPAFGLSKANLVYESEVEGGITRYLAIFADNEKIDEIGPIRSARPYFVELAQEFDAFFVHCGGSPEALAKIAKENVFDINEFYNSKYFWRYQRLSAPHNILTSRKLMNKYIRDVDVLDSKFLSWKYKEDKKTKEAKNKTIKIEYKKPHYAVEWRYDEKNNNYIRYLAGEQHKDANGDEIRAKNVIIQYVYAKVIDDKLRLKMDIIGSGDGIACLDGSCSNIKWNKANASSRTRYYHGDEELKFNAGTTWIEIVRPEIKTTPEVNDL